MALYPANMMRSKAPTASVDMLEKELTNFEIKSIMKVSKECHRTNHYKHMHGRASKAEFDEGNRDDKFNQNESKSAMDNHLGAQIAENGRMRNTLSSKEPER